MSKQVDRARQQGWKDGLQYALKLIREGKEEGKDPDKETRTNHRKTAK